MVNLTYGIEEEFFVVNSALSSITVPLEVFKQNPEFDSEMHKSVLELKTKIHSSTTSLIDEVQEQRKNAQVALKRHGLFLLGTGTHPFQKDSSSLCSEGPYFEELRYKYQHLVEDNYICGMHMHIGSKSSQETLRIYNNLIDILPLLLAISANSPYWQGVDTGLLSYRSRVWKRIPRTFSPEPIADVEEYLKENALLYKHGLNIKSTSIWSDLRIHPLYKTVEIRIMDAQHNIENVKAIAVLIAAFCQYILEKNITPNPYKKAVFEENLFLASRFGTNAYFYNSDFTQTHCIQQLNELIENIKPYFQDSEDILYLMSLTIKGSPAIEQKKLIKSGLASFKNGILV